MLKVLRKYTVSILVAVVLLAAFIGWSKSRGFSDTAMAGIPEYSDVDQSSILGGTGAGSKLEPSYTAYASQAGKNGAADTKGIRTVIRGADYKAISPAGAAKRSDPEGRIGDVLALADEGGWVEYEVQIAEAGFYQMGITYYALEGKGSSVQRSVQIDGSFPFSQTKRIVFPRMWKEAAEPWFDKMGNEFNPKQAEVSGWQYRDFRDPEARVAEPFRYYLTKGAHTVRIGYIREPAAIGELRVFSPVVLPTYEEVSAVYKQKGYQTASDTLIKVQAEAAALKSDPTLRRVDDREPATEPFERSVIRLNTIGGGSWRDGSQWLEWEVEAPESALYNLGSRFAAKWLNQVPVQRTLYIDGAVPFREMNSVDFPYGSSWQVQGFGDKETPYLFYLEKGKHRLRLEVQVGQLGPVFEIMQDVSTKMSYLNREVILITGTNPDPNREWELEKSVPNLVPRLHLMARDLDRAIQTMYGLGVEKGSTELASILMARDLMIDLAAKPDTIPKRIDSFSTTQTSLSSWITSMNKQKLQLDYVVLKSPDRQWPEAGAGAIKQFALGVYDFFTSFTKDYRKIGSTRDDNGNTLKVWVARGRDWVQLIKQMADDDFTAKTGINVEVNIIPTGSMNLFMLAMTSGKAPDVALGVDAGIPIDFALRDGLVDLGKFADYKDVAARYRPGALVPYRFQNGNYALPENQNFYMMFYRKDIMEELGITKIPETWQEVMDIIPKLQQNGMDFYYPHDTTGAAAQFAPFLFQLGGDFYGTGGKASALDTPQALAAMKMWSGFYTNYKISKEASFYNRFRTGEMPIGVADYQTYMQLSTAAPELTGWWEMRPIPGIRRADGVIDRSMGGASQTGVMFSTTKKEQESWEFLKWWTSAAVQERFGSELEAIMGTEARWNTANVEALRNLPWPQADISAILRQWDWFKEREIVPGDYYTTRYINNIWNEIVLNGKNTREALEDGVKEINKEIRKKRKEFQLDEPLEASAANGGGDRR
ncbi:extracellular solute-binding protein [Paenibacillus hodogayensis]